MPDYRLGKLKGRWVCVWYDEAGKRHRHRLDAGSPVEARAELREFIRRADEIARPKDKLTVGEIWADYVAEKEAQGKVSVSRMRDAWKQLAPVFSACSPASLSGDDIRGYIDRRGTGVSSGTLHTELGYLRAALRHSGFDAKFKLPSKPRPRAKHLTGDEARKLLDATQMPHVRLFILLSLHTAGRPSSILGLQWNRVDFDRRRINLDDPARDRTAKGRALVPMDERLVEPLLAAREAARTPFVIEWAGRPIQSIKKAIARTAAKCGMDKVTPYVLRHTAAVWMAEGGISMEEIAQYMGHTSPAVTFRTYARYSPEYQRKASNVISTVLHGGAEPEPVNGK